MPCEKVQKVADLLGRSEFQTGHQSVECHDDGAVVDGFADPFLYFGFDLTGQCRQIDETVHQGAFKKRFFLDDFFYGHGNRDHDWRNFR